MKCAVEGCDRTAVARGWCKTHWHRWYKTGDVQAHIPIGQPRANKGTDSYAMVHRRVYALHGKASTHQCVDCGGRAKHWSYTRDDPDEKRTTEGYPYSSDPARYVPRCPTCHASFDGFCKLTNTDVEDIRAAHAAGEKSTSIANRYGITRPFVSQIIHDQRRA